MSELTVEVQRRELTGKNPNRRLRESGLIPAVVYGENLDSFPIQVDRKKVRQLMRSGGDNAVFQLKLEGTKTSRHAMIRDLAIDPISRQIIHIDFMRINMTEKVKVHVAIELEGEAYGVKTDGGVLDFMLREVEVECLPGDIPAAITLDVSELRIGDHIEAGQLDIPPKVELVEDESRVIVTVSHAKVVEEEEGTEEGLLIEAGTEEPEVIGKAKEDDEAD